MVLGTASHVGKSVTVAALCRLLNDRGISVAPFKSQNMSLNSYVTPEGDEIGIAQAVQAYAARVVPTSDMNPVLLKPKGDTTTQVVLHGKPYCDVHIGEYYLKTEFLLEEVVRAYRRLDEQYETVIVEGAGGAAELNLYDRDIANILLAEELQIPIVLVADIERGGVFAQIYGTLALLPEAVREHVVGIIINKFRGDPALFEKGVKQIEELTGVQVLGVVPYTDTGLPSEDSLSIADKRAVDAPVRIGIIRLPRISNFTDFELLERRCAVHYIQPGESLEGCDCIILPGTKNSVEDLLTIRETGTADAIIRLRNSGIPVIGICGGFQMLGREIIDDGIESGIGRHAGLCLLDVVTHFDAYRKTTVQVRRRAAPVPPILSAVGEVSGYEIHMGETRLGADSSAFDGDGAVSDDGLVFGTYMHGLFQNPGAVDALLSYLHSRRGLSYEAGPGTGGAAHDPAAAWEQAFDRFARHFEEHVDITPLVPYFTEE